METEKGVSLSKAVLSRKIRQGGDKMKYSTAYIVRAILTNTISGVEKCIILPLDNQEKRMKIYEKRDSTPCKIDTDGVMLKVVNEGKYYDINTVFDTREVEKLINSFKPVKDETTIFLMNFSKFVVEWKNKVAIEKKVVDGDNGNEVCVNMTFYTNKNKPLYRIKIVYEYNMLLHTLQCKISLEYMKTILYLGRVQLDLTKNKEDYINKYKLDLQKPVNDIMNILYNKVNLS